MASENNGSCSPNVIQSSSDPATSSSGSNNHFKPSLSTITTGADISVRPIPEGYHSITPYLMINGAAEAIEFYRRAFGATQLFRLDAPVGKIGHAEIQIGDSLIMMTDDCGGESPFRNRESSGGSPVGLHLYVEDVDIVFAQAVSAGATVIKPVQDRFYGDRTGALKVPFGHIWFLATHKEELSPDEIKQRAETMFKQLDPDTAPS